MNHIQGIHKKFEVAANPFLKYLYGKLLFAYEIVVFKEEFL